MKRRKALTASQKDGLSKEQARENALEDFLCMHDEWGELVELAHRLSVPHEGYLKKLPRWVKSFNPIVPKSATTQVLAMVTVKLEVAYGLLRDRVADEVDGLQDELSRL